MERAHNTTGTEELCMGFGGEGQKFCALVRSQAKDLFHTSRPNNAKHHKKQKFQVAPLKQAMPKQILKHMYKNILAKLLGSLLHF